MKIASSLKSLKKRDLNSKLVRRRGRVYIINKKNPKFKARQKQVMKNNNQENMSHSFSKYLMLAAIIVIIIMAFIIKFLH